MLGTSVAAAALAAGTMPLWAVPAGAAAVASPVVTFIGSAGAMPTGSATIVVEAELAQDVNAKGLPQKLVDIPVATESISTSRFSVPVASSAVLDEAEQQGHGTVNFNIIVVSGTHMTSQYVPAPLTPAAAVGNTAALAIEAAHMVRVPAFPAYRTVSGAVAPQFAAVKVTPNVIGGCTWRAWTTAVQDATRIGEVHVANVNGVTDRFVFSNTNDLTITVGLSAGDPDGHFSASGSVTLTNSVTAGGGTTFPAGTVQYVNDDVEYQEFQGVGDLCPGWPLSTPYKVQAVGSESDVFHGIHTPPESPWAGGCVNDPLHAELPPSSSWARDTSRAASYNGIATYLGFSFGGSDGFTTDVQHYYASTSSSPTTYICGPKDGLDAPHAPILYNNP